MRQRPGCLTRPWADSPSEHAVGSPCAPVGLLFHLRLRAELNCALPLVRSMTGANLLCFM